MNGAGLAMNTTDSLVALGGRPSNFLDTGGKATSETVSQSFRTVLTDPNVTAIFVSPAYGRYVARSLFDIRLIYSVV